MQNNNLNENRLFEQKLLNMRNSNILDPGGFNEESDVDSLPQDNNYLSPSQIRTYDYTAKQNEVKIPLGILKSRGFDTERRPSYLELLFCGCFSFLIRVILTASLGSFLFGFNIALLNTSLDTIALDLGWCELPGDRDCSKAVLYKALTSVSVFVGGAAGSTTGGKFSFIGRRMALLLVMVVISVGITTSVVADSVAVLIWARLIVGYGIGVVSVIVPIYISEMSPVSSRGFYGGFHQLFLTFGIFVAVLIGFPIRPTGEIDKATYELPTFNKIWWRLMLGFGYIPVIISFYLFIFVMNFETPHYYIENNHPQEAKKILRVLYNKPNVEMEVSAIIKAKQEAEKKSKNDLTFRKALMTPLYRKVILIGCALAALQQFTGITVFIASSNSILKTANLSPTSITIATIVILGLNFLLTIPGIVLIDILGRKTLLLFGTFGMGLSILPSVIYLWIKPGASITTYLSIGGSVLFIIFFSSTYGPVLWVYLFEIYPLNIKGTATGVATACNWIAGIFIVFAAQFLPLKINFLIFSITSLLTSLFVYTMIKETKGRSLEDSPYFEKEA